MSILKTEYKEPTRPYSQKELQSIQNKLYKDLYLSNVEARHQNCGHKYLVKKNGRKEKDILENISLNPDKYIIDNSDVGNCSVCWKLNKTPNKYKDKATNIIYWYNRINNDNYLSYFDINVENIYYKWLYDNNDKNNNDKNNNDKNNDEL